MGLPSGSSRGRGLRRPSSRSESLSDKYAVLERIGKGAFGEAYEVEEKRTRQRYVLKKIRLARQDERQREASKQEMEMYKTLNHPFVVQCKESWVEGGHTICLVLSKCSGGDFSSLLREAKRSGQRINEEQLRKWLSQSCLALAYIHSMDVLHRDIKTSNIFLTAPPSMDVQVGDFGLSKQLGAEQGKETTMVGTPGFIAPEQMKEQPYDHKVDTFSLGIVFYELTAKRPAFSAFDISGLFHKVKNSSPPSLPKEYSQEWRSLIRDMLKKDPAERPSAADILAYPFLAPYVERARLRSQELSTSPCPGAPSPAVVNYDQGSAVANAASSPTQREEKEAVREEGESRGSKRASAASTDDSASEGLGEAATAAGLRAALREAARLWRAGDMEGVGRLLAAYEGGGAGEVGEVPDADPGRSSC